MHTPPFTPAPPAIGSHVRRTIAAAALLCACVLAPLTARPLLAQSPSGLSAVGFDSVRVGLTSGDWNERHAALARLNAAYVGPLPGVVVPWIVATLGREAATIHDHEGDEDFGEYLGELVFTGVRTGDARTIPGILALDGLSMSTGVAAFVVSQGRSVMPALDSLAATREDRASDVAEAYGLMYARYGARLTREDSAQVLRRLVAVAYHPSPVVRAQLAYVVGRGPIPELLPLIAELAASDSGQLNGVYIVRKDAAMVLPELTRARAALPVSALLDRLTALTGAACNDADRLLRWHCGALAVSLGSAVRLAAIGQTRLAVAALDVYRGIARRTAAEGLLPRLTTVTLDGSAAGVVERLAPR
ncbi:MAG TPA: hypothetical protein VGD56_21175 [Gemmatirosa sp.]